MKRVGKPSGASGASFFRQEPRFFTGQYRTLTTALRRFVTQKGIFVAPDSALLPPSAGIPSPLTSVIPATRSMLDFMKPLSERICLVTGGTRGIGRAIAKMLLLEGAAVAICGQRQETVDRAVAELAAETAGKVRGKAADVRNYEQVGELFRFVDAELGGLDVLVNNAGIGVFRHVRELSLDEWKQTMETNLYGAFYCSREALFRLGTKNGGYIVNISSMAGANAFAGGAAYNASKFGLTGFTEAMMQDVRNENVRVSYIMPGSVATGFSGHFGGAEWKIWPQDVAEIVLMLLQLPERTLVSRVEVRPAKPKR
jgi:3-oxoacyl-[acyl-carrier protein] reductase